MTAFSDFPVRAHRAEQMLASEYGEYLAEYCEAFGLGRWIRFGSTVEAVTRTPEGGWVVRTVDREGARPEERYDAVAVCSGLHQRPHRPRIAGDDAFTGTIVHASQYGGPEQVAGKRVLVVGGGESAADLVAEVSDGAKETVLSLRRGVSMVPRRVRGVPNDYRLSRIIHSAPHWLAQTRNPEDEWRRRRYQAALLPFAVFDKCARVFAWWCDLLYDLHPRRLPGGRAAVVEARTQLKTRRVVARLLRESGGGALEQFGTKSDEFARAIASGRCRRAGPIERFDGRRVIFEGGDRYEPDVVIFCTGFEPKVRFIDDSLAGGAERYLHEFDPAIGSSLGFVGFVRPAHGAIPPMSELQARYFGLVLSGRAELPPEKAMRESIARLAAVRAGTVSERSADASAISSTTRRSPTSSRRGSAASRPGPRSGARLRLSGCASSPRHSWPPSTGW